MRILFCSEAVTLAHVGRIAALAARAAASGHDVAIAADPRAHWALIVPNTRFLPLTSISPQDFQRALASGRPVFTRETLMSYIEADLTMLAKVRPELVVGDFRLSLGVSARKNGVRYIAIANAHWSPSRSGPWPHPWAGLARFVGEGVTQRLFDTVRPWGFRRHAEPYNDVRRRYGLPACGDVREVYTDADEVWFDDVAALHPNHRPRPHERFVGPIMWEPSVPLPSWWNAEKEFDVYFSPGSSGDPRYLPKILQALDALNLRVACAVPEGIEVPPRFQRATYLPGGEAARRARVVVGNGGIGIMHQAMMSGRPLLGLTFNMDQRLAMQPIVSLGAGVERPAESITPRRLNETLVNLLENPAWSQAAQSVQKLYQAAPTPVLW